MTSAGHVIAPCGGIAYSSLRGPGGDPWTEYAQSKWGCIALARYVAAHHDMPAHAVHPGPVSTNLMSHLPDIEEKRAGAAQRPAILQPAVTQTEGALNQLWVANLSEDEARALNGSYIGSVQVPTRARPDLDNPKGWARLWEWCEEQGKQFEGVDGEHRSGLEQPAGTLSGLTAT